MVTQAEHPVFPSQELLRTAQAPHVRVAASQTAQHDAAMTAKAAGGWRSRRPGGPQARRQSLPSRPSAHLRPTDLTCKWRRTASPCSKVSSKMEDAGFLKITVLHWRGDSTRQRVLGKASDTCTAAFLRQKEASAGGSGWQQVQLASPQPCKMGSSRMPSPATWQFADQYLGGLSLPEVTQGN